MHLAGQPVTRAITPGGPGITFDARYDTPLAAQNLTNYPAAISLGYDHACIIQPQAVWRSVLYDRMDSTNAADKMPPLARNLIDTNAVALFAGWINSLPGMPALAPPVLSPNGGSFNASVKVAVTAPATNAVVYYTLDGSLPATNAPICGGTVALFSSATLSASAFAPGCNHSVSASATFQVQPAAFAFQTFTNHGLLLGFLGAPGSNYILQATTNLINSTPLGTNLAGTNPFTWFDGRTTNYPRRFYRVWQP